MEHSRKLTTLLDFTDAAKLLEALRKEYPDAVPAPPKAESAPEPASPTRQRSPEPEPKPESTTKAERLPLPARPAVPHRMRIAVAMAAAAGFVVVAAVWAGRGCGAPEHPQRGEAPASSAGDKPIRPAEPTATATPPRPASAGLPSPAATRSTLVALADVAPMRFVSLPGGTFQMGSPPGEANRDDDEKPHPAEVAPFELGIYEVTQKQWVTVMGTRPFDCAHGCGDDLPAQSVRWIDAVKFMNALTDRENTARAESDKRTRCYDERWVWDRGCTGFRLPTEAEWEYAARAGTPAAYSFGSDTKDLCAYANGADQAATRKHPDWTPVNECDDGYADLAPVGKFKPNRWGLYDMHGNVLEWVWDWYGDYPERAPVGYVGPARGERRVLRGGSFQFEPGRLRSSVRSRGSGTLVNIGFRCARGSLPNH